MEYRDHYPATDETRPGMLDAYIKTRALYEKLYGPVDALFWPEGPTTCGDSYSGFIPTESEKNCNMK